MVNLIRLSLLSLCFVLCACPPSGPRPSGGNTGVAANNGVKATFSLRPKAVVGQRTRTVRLMNGVDDSNPDVLLRYGQREIYTQRVLGVQDGLPSKVERIYETSATSVGTSGAMKSTTSPLEGEIIEMTQHAGGLSIRVIGGQVSEQVLRGLLINGFDVAILPTRDVALGDVWTIDVADNPGLESILKGFGLDGQSNVLSAQLTLVAEGVATITIDWRVTGDVGHAKAMVFRMQGEMLYELETGLIKEVSLNGGKRVSAGKIKQQISMTIKREIIESWLD